MPDEVRRLKLDSDVIVARALLASALRNREYYIPVVEIPVVGNDLIHSLYESKKRFNCSRAAVVGSINMILGAEELGEIVNLDIKTFLCSKW